MIKISGKVDESDTYDGFSDNISFWSSSVNKELNMTKSIVFDLSTFPLISILYNIRIV